MRLAFAAAVLLLASAQGARADMKPLARARTQAVGMQAPRGTKVDVYNTPNARGRVILIHGLSGSRAQMRTGPYKRLVAHLRAQGYQVIVPSLPYDTGQTQATHLQQVLPAQQGAAYEHTWNRRFNDLMSWADKRYGKAPTTVGGISWGGLHTLMAAARNPEVKNYFVHSPVVDPNFLSEFHSMPLANLQGTRFARSLSKKQGFISYGGADTRVGVAPVQSLVKQLQQRNARVQSIEYPTLDHSTDLQSVNDILKWTRSQRPKYQSQPRPSLKYNPR